MVTFLWVLGPTAVGKDTFIHKLANGELSEVVEHLGLRPPFIVNDDAMLLRHGQREDLAKKIASKTPNSGTILLKWQGADIKHQNLQKLEQDFPNAVHKHVFLDAPAEIITQRRHKRGDPADPWDDAKDREVCLDYAKQLEEQGIRLIWIDNSQNSPLLLSRQK